MYVFFFTLLPFAIVQVLWVFFLKYNVMHSLGFYLWVLQFSFNVPLSFEYSTVELGNKEHFGCPKIVP